MNIKQFKNNDLVDASFYIVNSEVNLPEALSKKITTMVTQERFSFKPKTTKVF